MNRVSWVGMFLIVFVTVPCIIARAPIWFAFIGAAIAYWQGHSFSMQLSKGSSDPNLFLKNFFSAPGEKARFKKLAVYWFVGVNIVGPLAGMMLSHNRPIPTINIIIAWVFIVLAVVPLFIFLILAAKKS